MQSSVSLLAVKIESRDGSATHRSWARV